MHGAIVRNGLLGTQSVGRKNLGYILRCKQKLHGASGTDYEEGRRICHQELRVMQANNAVTELLVLSGLDSKGRVAWMFVPGGWDIAALERRLPFSGSRHTPQREAVVPVDVARELTERYGERPFRELPDTPSLARLLSDDIAAVRILVARNQDSTFSAIPL